MSTTIKWNVFSDITANSFNVYKAITGIAVTFPNSLVVGDQLIFAATSSSVQTVTLSGTTINTVLANVNAQARGLIATRNTAGTLLFLRCSARTDSAKLKLYNCSFLTHTSQATRIIAPRTEFNLVTNIAVVLSQTAYTYTDADGDPTDWYHVTSVTGGIESVPSLDQQALLTPESLCVVEGRVIDIQNNPVVGAEVMASPIGTVELSDNSGLVTPDTTTLTDALGRWSIPLLQGELILFQIPAIGYNQVIKIPAQTFALFKDLLPTNDYYFSPTGDPQ